MKVSQFLESNLAWIIAGLLAFYTTYVIGGSQATHRMDRMAEQIRDLEADNKARRRFEQCIVANVADAEIPKIKALQCLAE